jgi:FdhE protein
MPYLPAAAIDPTGVLDSAERRWADGRDRRPELASALDLQRRLITIVVELATAVERQGLLPLALTPEDVAAKVARGVPALAGEPIALPLALLTPALLRLSDELGRGGAGEAAEHVQNAIESGTLDAGSLLSASLARDQHAIRQGAVHRGLAPDLVWLVAELAVSPVAHLLERSALGSPSDAVARALDAWEHGYCPACGSWPALAEVASGHRILRCSFCAAGWELRSYACIYCREDGDAFVTAAPDPDRKDRRVEVCSTCGGYLKSVDVAELSPFPLVAITDLETMDLDMAAIERRYGRPQLKSFAKSAGEAGLT